VSAKLIRVSLAFIAVVVTFPLPAPAQQIEWMKDFEAAARLARERARPLFVDFWASWCPPCLEMDKVVYTHPDVVKESADFVFVKVDIDKDGRTLRKYGVEAFPTMGVMDPWRTPLGWIRGYTKAEELVKALRVIPRDFTPIAPAFGVLDERADDYDALMAIGKFYDRPQFRRPALEFYERASKTPRVKTDPLASDACTLSLGLTTLNLGDAKRAVKILEKGIKECQGQNAPVMLVALGNAYFQNRKLTEARAAFEEVVAKFPGTEPARLAALNLQKMERP
jgi:thiol-disulfide isomerase/thioredoxin